MEQSDGKTGLIFFFKSHYFYFNTREHTPTFQNTDRYTDRHTHMHIGPLSLPSPSSCFCCCSFKAFRLLISSRLRILGLWISVAAVSSSSATKAQRKTWEQQNQHFIVHLTVQSVGWYLCMFAAMSLQCIKNQYECKKSNTCNSATIWNALWVSCFIIFSD